MNPTTGFFSTLYFSKYSAASSSIDPPISPIRTIPFVALSSMKTFKTSICWDPGKGSPPIPTQRD